MERWDDEIVATPAARFCAGCGAARPDGAAFCPSCGRSFIRAQVPSTSQVSTVTVSPPLQVTRRTGNSTAQFAGIAWLITAALIGYLAFEQWGVAAVLGTAASQLGTIALVNGLAALATAYFGARCLQQPTRGQLNNATAWAVLSVLSAFTKHLTARMASSS